MTENRRPPPRRPKPCRPYLQMKVSPGKKQRKKRRENQNIKSVQWRDWGTDTFFYDESLLYLHNIDTARLLSNQGMWFAEPLFLSILTFWNNRIPRLRNMVSYANAVQLCWPKVFVRRIRRFFPGDEERMQDDITSRIRLINIEEKNKKPQPTNYDFLDSI